MTKTPKILRSRDAGNKHRVVTAVSNNRKYMRKPCPDCPWRKDATGIFPAEAFRKSAHTSYDLSNETFGCHTSGIESPKTCAGFLLKGAAHNLSVRLGYLRGDYFKNDVSDEGHELFDCYTDMAVANGVDPNDHCLSRSRSGK